MLRSRSAGLILQVLLSGGTCRHTFGGAARAARLTGVTMIGAMPAVAVRHERRKQEKRGRRPSQLQLSGLKGRASPPSRGASPSPSPQSPPCVRPPDELPSRDIYVCGKVSVLHLVVVSLLLGTILLIVGLVQLKPGADASDHRYALLGSGGALVLIGAILAAVRCRLLPWRDSVSHESVERSHSQFATQHPQLQQQEEDQSEPPTADNQSITTEPQFSVSAGSHGILLSSPSEHDALIISNTVSHSNVHNATHVMSHNASTCACDPEKACTAAADS